MACGVKRPGTLVALAGSLWLAAAGGALALVSPEMFMHAVNTKRQSSISTSELDAYVDKRFDLIAGQGAKTVTSLRLGGRLTPDEFKKAQTSKHADPMNFSRDEFKAYAAMLAAQAHGEVKQDDSPQGTLSLDALRTDAGKSLIRLLE